MHVLYAGGYFNVAKQVDNLSVQVNFVDNDIVDGSIFIDDFRELGYEYLFHVKKENFIRCRECGILTRNNKMNNRKYCKKCACYTPIEYKEVICVDCGKSIIVNSLNKRTIRCDNCQYKINLLKRNDWKKNKLKNNETK